MFGRVLMKLHDKKQEISPNTRPKHHDLCFAPGYMLKIVNRKTSLRVTELKRSQIFVAQICNRSIDTSFHSQTRFEIAASRQNPPAVQKSVLQCSTIFKGEGHDWSYKMMIKWWVLFDTCLSHNWVTLNPVKWSIIVQVWHQSDLRATLETYPHCV